MLFKWQATVEHFWKMASASDCELLQQNSLFLGPTSTMVIQEFERFTSAFSTISSALKALVERSEYLKKRHTFTTDLTHTEWRLHLLAEDITPEFTEALKNLDDFAIRSRLDSRAAALEELLMSTDCKRFNNALPKTKKKNSISKCSYQILPSQSNRVKVRSVSDACEFPNQEMTNGLRETKWRPYCRVYLKTFECVKCGTVSDSKESYISHLNEHGEEPSPPCSYCGNFFPNMVLYEKHFGNLTSEPIFSCVDAHCSCKFVSWCRIACHERLHRGEKEFQCRVCEKGFSGVQKCILHAKNEHLVEPTFQCPICSKRFASRHLLLNHCLSHKEPKILKCPSCPRTFGSMPGLKSHFLMHQKLKPHKCQGCGKSFRNRTDLKNHERIHSGERPFTCEVCGKGFVEKAALRKHRIVHTREKRFICSKCGKQFGYKCSLTTHLKKCDLPPESSDTNVEEVVEIADLFQYPLVQFFKGDTPSASQDINTELVSSFETLQPSDPMEQDVLGLFDAVP